ncbi:MAG: Uma2 family endonuclease [Thermomicrobiales bacterium]
MVASAVPRPLTYEDLLNTPDDNNRYEIIGGELVVSPAPVPVHQEIIVGLILRIGGFVADRGLGNIYTSPIDVKLTEHNYVEPDIVFIRQERLSIVGPSYIDGYPDLIVEVLSPSSRRRDLVHKAALYSASGVQEYWQVDPQAKTLTINVLRSGHYLPSVHASGITTSEVLDGLAIDVAALFRNLT